LTSIAVRKRFDNISNNFSKLIFNLSRRWLYTSVAPGSLSVGRKSCRGGEKLGRASTSQST